MGCSANVAELPSWAPRLLEQARVAHLGLRDGDGAPRVLPITFAPCGEQLVTAVDHKPKRRTAGDLACVRRLRAHPQASIAAPTARYSPYVERPPAGPVLALTPGRLIWWRASE